MWLAVGDEISGEPELERSRGLQPSHRVVGQRELHRAHIVGELGHTTDADDRHDRRQLVSKPSQRHLRGTHAQLGGDLRDGLGRGTVAGSEFGRRDPAAVRARVYSVPRTKRSRRWITAPSWLSPSPKARCGVQDIATRVGISVDDASTFLGVIETHCAQDEFRDS
ncbi:hypothetical protein OHQ90_23640 [Nocardia sp. NBC_00403]